MQEITKKSPHLGCAFIKHAQGVPADDRQLLWGDRISPFHFYEGLWLTRVYRWWRSDWTFVGMVRLPPDQAPGLKKTWDRGVYVEPDFERGRVPECKVNPAKYLGDSVAVEHPPNQNGMRFALIDSRYGIWRAENSSDVYCGTIVDVVLWANTPTLDCPALYI